MGQYGNAAVEAIKILELKKCEPREAWFEAIGKYTLKHTDCQTD